MTTATEHTENEFKLMHRFYAMGRETALALKVGDNFTGAFGAAERANISPKTEPREHAAFVAGYLDNLKRSVTVIQGAIASFGD